jgi:sigma-B regulation protein RsbU (phosphoserine phosphatase)
LIRHAPQSTPGELWHGLNRAFVGNIRERLEQDEHMTLSLFRYHHDGRFQVVGAHEEAVIWRTREKRAEIVPVKGTWIGMRSLSPKALELALEEQTFTLERDDLLVLYTDGIIEAKHAAGGEVGIERLIETVERHNTASVTEIRDAVFALAANNRLDDASLMVFRYVGTNTVASA